METNEILDTIAQKMKSNGQSFNTDYRIRLSGQDMIDMGWEIGDDSPDDIYWLVINVKNAHIHAEIFCNNNETVDSGFGFDFEDTLQDLQKHGYLK